MILSKRENRWLFILSVLFTLGMSFYLLFTLDWPAVFSTFANLHWGWFFASLLSYFISLYLRSVRFKNLLYSKETPILLLLPITSLHNMFNYILPARSGELSYILLSNRKLNIPLIEGTATLLASRFYDLAIVAVLLAVMLPFFFQEFPLWILQAALLYCLGVLLVFGVVVYLTRKPIVLTKTVGDKAVLGKVKSLFARLLLGFREIREKNKPLLIAIYTLGVWLFLYATFYFITLGLGYHVSYIKMILISLVMVPLSTLPLQGFANMGTHELGWVTVLMIFGYPYEISLSIAVGSHLLVLICVLFFGLLSSLVINNSFFQKLADTHRVVSQV